MVLPIKVSVWRIFAVNLRLKWKYVTKSKIFKTWQKKTNKLKWDLNRMTLIFSYKKKGMMDIALLTANANQLRFLITYNSEEKTFMISATLIILSLFVQVAVGIGMIFKVCLNIFYYTLKDWIWYVFCFSNEHFQRQMKKKGNTQKADKIGSIVISGIFCLAVINVLVVSFTTTTTIKSPS